MLISLTVPVDEIAKLPGYPWYKPFCPYEIPDTSSVPLMLISLLHFKPPLVVLLSIIVNVLPSSIVVTASRVKSLPSRSNLIVLLTVRAESKVTLVNRVTVSLSLAFSKASANVSYLGLKNDYVLNLDGDVVDQIFISAAGVDDNCIRLLKFKEDFVKTIDLSSTREYTISISGLLGGHSATNINSNRANAITLLADLINEIIHDYNDLNNKQITTYINNKISIFIYLYTINK